MGASHWKVSASGYGSKWLDKNMKHYETVDLRPLGSCSNLGGVHRFKPHPSQEKKMQEWNSKAETEKNHPHAGNKKKHPDDSGWMI